MAAWYLLGGQSRCIHTVGFHCPSMARKPSISMSTTTTMIVLCVKGVNVAVGHMYYILRLANWAWRRNNLEKGLKAVYYPNFWGICGWYELWWGICGILRHIGFHLSSVAGLPGITLQYQQHNLSPPLYVHDHYHYSDQGSFELSQTPLKTSAQYCTLQCVITW